MSKLTRKRAILAKIEGTYGTDPTPTGSANAMLIKNLSITPLSANLVSRDNIKAYIGQDAQLLANSHVEVSFDVEMAGSGALGTAPAYGPLLRACGFAETITASTKVEYSPVSSSFESVTIYANVDGILHKVTGARGTLDINLNAREIPSFSFKMVGIYNAPTDTALPATTLTAFQTPLVANNTNTPTFSFFSVSSLVLESLKISLNNSVDFRALIGSESVQIMDRKASGEISFEAPALATLNTFSTALATTSGALSIVHGTSSGNKVQLDAPAVTLGNPAYADNNGVTMINSPLFFLPSSGNDELKITII